MCRWLAYSGSPLLLEEMLYKPDHSLIDQSRHARLGVDTTNGDGFGVGWYGTGDVPGLLRSVSPAWSDRNLRELATHVSSPLFMAHVRSSTGTPVQQTNCHPFRYERWLWMHNGSIARFATLRRDLMLAVGPEFFPAIEGSTDSELMFVLALTLGLRDDPPGAVARMVGIVEAAALRHGVADPVQMTVATSDGSTVWAFRYSTRHQSRSLFYSTETRCLRMLHPEIPMLRLVSDESRLIVSEPLVDLPGAWNEMPESAYSVIADGRDEIRPFRPEPPR
ncbi:class II glutamine amidotransferase [Dactylosporangium matsuzakiense]|uniref:Class II glutamine amidotransferase n=1 Tax=Dactylosporangium matsuzakiense TaxID=53360 RepID=A0A9W6KUD2_9ACTN|nr:class II glutamine amidotransferase [Dactylosporangium matsuzakiense]UWZ47680.1 class II glutamine amidotransferase [Dactylosporangium matsuzakiense]GLL05634.1 class II glutamine amidotransferase [Dactylosporangium matsuzakiense]